MTARAPSFPPLEDPVLRAIARAPMGEPETPEERAIVDAAKAEVAGGAHGHPRAGGEGPADTQERSVRESCSVI
jgi:hypothetical protein